MASLFITSLLFVATTIGCDCYGDPGDKIEVDGTTVVHDLTRYATQRQRLFDTEAKRWLEMAQVICLDTSFGDTGLDPVWDLVPDNDPSMWMDDQPEQCETSFEDFLDCRDTYYVYATVIRGPLYTRITLRDMDGHCVTESATLTTMNPDNRFEFTAVNSMRRYTMLQEDNVRGVTDMNIGHIIIKDTTTGERMDLMLHEMDGFQREIAHCDAQDKQKFYGIINLQYCFDSYKDKRPSMYYHYVLKGQQTMHQTCTDSVRAMTLLYDDKALELRVNRDSREVMECLAYNNASSPSDEQGWGRLYRKRNVALRSRILMSHDNYDLSEVIWADTPNESYTIHITKERDAVQVIVVERDCRVVQYLLKLTQPIEHVNDRTVRACGTVVHHSCGRIDPKSKMQFPGNTAVLRRETAAADDAEIVCRKKLNV